MPRGGFSSAMTVQRVFSISKLADKNAQQANLARLTATEEDSSTSSSETTTPPAPPSRLSPTSSNVVTAPAEVPPVASSLSRSQTVRSSKGPKLSDRGDQFELEGLIGAARLYIKELSDIISQLADIGTGGGVASELLPNETNISCGVPTFPSRNSHHAKEPSDVPSDSTSDLHCVKIVEEVESCNSFTEDTSHHFLDAMLRSTIAMDKMTDYIRKHGPNTQFGSFVLNEKTYLAATPLALAAMRDHEPLMNMLLEAQANPDSEYSFSAGLSRFPWSGPCLTIPVIKGNVPKVKTMMEMRANIHARSNNGATMLWEAAYNGHTAMVEFLVKQGVDMELSAMFQDDLELEYTPLHVAVKFGRKDTVETLLNCLADCTVADKNGRTPLVEAIYSNFEMIVKVLTSSLCAGLTAKETAVKNGVSAETLHSQFMFAIAHLFEHANPAVILAFAQGMVTTPLIMEILPRTELLKFLNAPLKTPLTVLRACFSRQQLAYVDQGKRIILTGTYIAKYGDMRVKSGVHYRRILELYFEKVQISPGLLTSIERLAPQRPTFPSEPYMTAGFWMCCIAHIDRDTEVLQALLRGELDNFGDWTVKSIVDMRWERAKGGHHFLQFCNFLNILFWTALNFAMWGREGLDDSTALIITKTLMGVVAFLWCLDLVHAISYFAGYVHIARYQRYLRSGGRLIDWGPVVLPGSVMLLLQLFGTEPLRYLAFRVLLGVVLFMRWVLMIYTLRTNLVVGTAIMSILSSMMTCLPFVIVLFSFICGVWNLYLAFGILNPADSLSVVWRMIVLGDIDLWEMDGLSGVLEPAKYDDVYYLIRVFMVMGTFFFGLSLMNVFIAILAEAYLQAEEQKWKRFYRQRALLANRNELQILGVQALRRRFATCVWRLIPWTVRHHLKLRSRHVRKRTAKRYVSNATKEERLRNQKHMMYIKNSVVTDSVGALSSLSGDKQSYLWVARPESSKA